MMAEDALGLAGLTKNEATVYLSLLHFGPASAGEIIRKTGLNRQSCYSALQRLVVKGLASHITKNRVMHFEAASADHAISIVRAKIRETEPLLVELSTIQKTPSKFNVEIFEGKEGLKLLLEDVLKTGESYLGFFTGIPKKMLGPWYLRWDRRRAKLGIRRKTVASPQTRPFLSKSALTSVRYLPVDYSLPSGVIIYGKKVFIYVPPEEDLVLVLFESERIADAYRNYFNAMWKIASE